MALSLSPAKLVLLAVHFAVNADIASFAALTARHGTILRKDLLLRILLTYLPETLRSTQYVDFIRDLESGSVSEAAGQDVDCSIVEALLEDEAARKVRRLRLLPLALPEALGEFNQDVTTLFLLRRSYKVDEEAGLLNELPDLLLPFLDHSPCIRRLLVATILPLLRRNCEYYPRNPIPYTLLDFQQLPDSVAVNLLLSQTGAGEGGLSLIGRDLKGLIGPWLSDERRWKCGGHSTSSTGDPGPDDRPGDESVCPGWEEVLRWLTMHASRSWRVAVHAVQQWDDPGDADLAGWGAMRLDDRQREYLGQGYGRAALASAYLIPEASLEALEGAYNIITRVSHMRGLEPISPLASALAVLPPLTEQISDDVVSARNTTYMRNDLLSTSNMLTTPTNASIAFLQAVILSAHILTKAGCPCTVRRAGELALLKDEREQKAEAVKLIHALSNKGSKTDDKFWVKARHEVLWLSDWGAEDGWALSETTSHGIFSEVKREFLEVEVLKALLANTRYALARSIYEDAPDQPLNGNLLEDTIIATALSAYDNASNPNRTHGGLKKCDDIIKAFPKTIQKSHPAAARTEALLQATHALSGYRLVLKQGEPFTPVVLRVHADPISIIGKILEQNPKSYTQIQDLIDLGIRMVEAGLVHPLRDKNPLSPEATATHRATAERRITAMCIDAALTEDDFETAYSYVMNRLSSLADSPLGTDEYSWKAALQAGKYRRTARTMRPTHLGTASANADVRHLEQRIDCLATALRIAPPPTLQEILNAFRRAEEELDAALLAEQQQEEEWDARGDSMRGSSSAAMPGAFASGAAASKPRAAVPTSSSSSRRQRQAAAAEEAPMSLFDLSRASVLSAQRNFSALSALQRSAGFGVGGGGGSARSSLDQQQQPPLSPTGTSDGEEAAAKRVRKRDQLREAAMGTLVSGVGWLVGAQPPPAHGHAQGRE